MTITLNIHDYLLENRSKAKKRMFTVVIFIQNEPNLMAMVLEFCC